MSEKNIYKLAIKNLQKEVKKNTRWRLIQQWILFFLTIGWLIWFGIWMVRL